MIRYILKRLLWMIPTVLGVVILVFTLLYFTPGDPAEIIAGDTATQEQIEETRVQLGLDQPYIVQLSDYLESVIIHQDFGSSYLDHSDVGDQLAERFPRTLILSLTTMIVGVVFGVPLGIIAAVKQDTIGDRLSMLLALLGIAIPNFWLALLLVLLFSVHLGWLPAMGFSTPAHYVLPTIAGSLFGISFQARQSRSSMLEVIRSDFMTTARSKGISEMRVILRHGLQNAMIPILTVTGGLFASMLGGSLILEQIFGIPGIGNYVITAVGNRDYPIIRSGSLVLAVAFGVVMLIVDLLYAWVDPRIRAQYAKGRSKK